MNAMSPPSPFRAAVLRPLLALGICFAAVLQSGSGPVQAHTAKSRHNCGKLSVKYRGISPANGIRLAGFTVSSRTKRACVMKGVPDFTLVAQGRRIPTRSVHDRREAYGVIDPIRSQRIRRGEHVGFVVTFGNSPTGKSRLYRRAVIKLPGRSKRFHVRLRRDKFGHDFRLHGRSVSITSLGR